MTKAKTDTTQSLYVSYETFDLTTDSGEIVSVKYLKPGLQQLPYLLKFVSSGVRDILYSPEQYSKFTYMNLVDDCAKHYASYEDKVGKVEYFEFLGKVFMNAEAMDNLNKVLKYSFPELEIERLSQLVYIQCANKVIQDNATKDINLNNK